MSIGYVTIGALDSEKSGAFYDAVLGAVGYKRAFSDGGWIGYGPKGSDEHDVFVCPPFDKKPARAGNGIMIAFTAKSEDEVKAAHAAGLSHGGSDEGAPGFRPADKKTWYGAYLRDPTGNKVCVFWKPWLLQKLRRLCGANGRPNGNVSGAELRLPSTVSGAV